MSQMLKSSGAVAAATMTSRILGLVREMAYAWFMGASWVAGAFLLAFMIPNLFRRLLGEGALTAAFIPTFKQKEKLESPAAMWGAANAVLAGLILVLSALVLLGMLSITALLLYRGWDAGTHLMLNLLRIMFPYVLLVCIAALFMGILNARGHFFIPALGSTLLNVVLIGSVFLLAPFMGDKLEDKIYGLALGVLVAGLVQALFQWPLLHREGYRWQWVNPMADPTVHHVIRQMIPGTIGVAAYQINVLLTNGFAWISNPEIVASFNFAVRLMELPQGVFGLSLATYLLPTLAGLAAEKKYPEFRSTLAQGIGYLVFINLLASVLLLTLAQPIVRLLFERGQFDSHDTERCALALSALAPGLIAFSTVNILARAYYALGDIKTPMKISVFCLGLNIVLVAALIWRWKEFGLGLANSTTAFINVGLLLFILRKKLSHLQSHLWKNHLAALLGAALVAGLAAYFSARFWEQHWGHDSLLLRLGEVFAPMTLAALLYFGLCLWLKVPFAFDLFHLLAQRFRKKA